MGKRKAARYIDRNQMISNRKELPNMLEDTIACSIDYTMMLGHKVGSSISQYNYRLVVKSPKKDILDAVVMKNGLCVLFLSTSKQSILDSLCDSSGSTYDSLVKIDDSKCECNFTFTEEIITFTSSKVAKSGKKGKEARLVNAGDFIGKLNIRISEDKESLILLKTPIGGQLLELNDKMLI